MQEQRLYIDGELMDIDDGTNISLKYTSNFLRDVGKMASNHTYTCRLPATVHNMKVIGHAASFGNGTFFPYTTHTAEFYRNGVCLISGGRAVLLEISESIEVILTWGFHANISKMISEAISVNELNGDYAIEYNEHNDIAKWNDFTISPDALPYFYALIKYSRDNEDEELNAFEEKNGLHYSGVRPVARVNWLLNLISARYGISFSFPQDALEKINRMIIPCIGIEATQASAVTSGLTVTNVGQSLDLRFTTDDNGRIFDTTTGVVQWLSVSADKEVTFSFDVLWEIPKNEAWNMCAAFAMICVGLSDDNGNAEYSESDMLPVNKVTEAGDYMHLKITKHLDISINAGQKVFFRIAPKRGKEEFMVSTFSMRYLKHVRIWATLPAGKDVQLGQKYPILNNLPDIKVVDLLKFISAITCTFPKMVGDSEDGMLKFVSYESVMSNVGDKSLDWSSRLLPSYTYNRANELRFVMSDWAQKNIYRYKRDESVSENHDGTLLIANRTLPAERNAIEFPFAASDTKDKRAEVAIYQCSNTQEIINGIAAGKTIPPKYSAKKVEPRILLAAGENPYNIASGQRVVGSFDGLDAQSTIITGYNLLKMAMNKARVVKDVFLLSDIDLLNFDETTPVYLSQYGAYFLVLEINSKDNGMAEVTMIEISI